MSDDLSTPEPIDGPPWPEWTGNDARRCAAHKKTGEQCRRHARRGTTVCDWHGAKAPQVKARARQRLEEAADRMARELLKMATDAETSDATKLAAIRDALDRGGVSAKTQVEVGVELKPYEQVLVDITGVAHISRAESRARRGLTEDAPALPAEPLEVLDAEILPQSTTKSVLVGNANANRPVRRRPRRARR